MFASGDNVLHLNNFVMIRVPCNFPAFECRSVCKGVCVRERKLFFQLCKEENWTKQLVQHTHTHTRTHICFYHSRSCPIQLIKCSLTQLKYYLSIQKLSSHSDVKNKKNKRKYSLLSVLCFYVTGQEKRNHLVLMWRNLRPFLFITLLHWGYCSCMTLWASAVGQTASYLSGFVIKSLTARCRCVAAKINKIKYILL